MTSTQLSSPKTSYSNTALHSPKAFSNITSAGHVIVGASVSSTVTLNEHEEVLPDPSVTTYVFTVVPNGNASPEANPNVCSKVTSKQLSSPKTSYSNTALHSPKSFSNITSAGHVIVGASVSSTVTLNEQEIVLPASSVTS